MHTELVKVVNLFFWLKINIYTVYCQTQKLHTLIEENDTFH